MAMVLDAAVGAVVGELLRAVLDVKDRAANFNFKPTLEKLEKTLRSREVINQIQELNRRLDWIGQRRKWMIWSRS